MSAFALAAGDTYGNIAILVWSISCSLLVIGTALRLAGNARRSFLTLGIAGLIFLVGIVVRTVHGEAIGVEQPLPSPADLFHVPGYLMFFAVVVMLHRARSQDRDLDAWVDSISFSLSFGAVLWAMFLGDFVINAEDTLLEIALHLGYNLVILGTLAVGLRIAASPGSRPASYYLLGAGCWAFVVADLNATWASTASQTAYLTIALSPLIYGFCAAGATHSTAQEAFEPAVRAEDQSLQYRTLFVLGALLAPALLVIVADNSSPVARSTSLLVAVVVAMLVSFRVFRLLRAEADSRANERALGEELVALSSLGSVEEIRAVLPHSAARIASQEFEMEHLDRGAEGTCSRFPLPSSLRVGLPSGTALVTHPAFTTAQDKRLVETLVRDAGTLSNALEVNAQIERQRSQADAAAKIAANEQRFRLLLQNSADAIVVFNPEDGVVSYASDSVERLLGHRADDFVGQTLEWTTHERDWDFAVRNVRATAAGDDSTREFVLRARHADGSIRLLECLLTNMTKVEGIDGMVMNATDCTEMRELEAGLQDATTTDSLTGLLNRESFIKETEAAIRRATARDATFGLAIINVDDFRSINESYGTALADRVLVEIADRVRQTLRFQDPVARLNGDELGLLFPVGESLDESEAAIERVLAAIAEPIGVEGRVIRVSATSGLVVDTSMDADAISMLSRADTALEIAKRTHRGGVLHFDQEMGAEASIRIGIRNSLLSALRSDKLRLNFQPIIDIESGKVVSLEALARWHDEVLGEISPGTFIPIAEGGGMINELGDWAMRKACHHLSEWQEMGLTDFDVSVNMSAHQLRDEHIIERLRSVLNESAIDPGRITIELTESVLLDDTDFTAERLRKIRELGLKLAIDDFGTGYSSFSYLRRYEFDSLKIDRSFVTPLCDDTKVREREIVNAMIKLSQALGAVTTAEGIEENEQYAVLRTLGCDRAQGFLFFRPAEAHEIPDILRDVNVGIGHQIWAPD